MISKKEILWKELEKLDLTDYAENRAISLTAFHNQLNDHTGRYNIFNQNLTRALILYDLIGHYKVEEGLINTSKLFFMEMVLLNLITSLEVYLKDTFLTIAPFISLETINDKKTFVKSFKTI